MKVVSFCEMETFAKDANMPAEAGMPVRDWSLEGFSKGFNQGNKPFNLSDSATLPIDNVYAAIR